MTELPVQRLLLEVISVMDRLKIAYMIMGGFAVRTWGVPRPTYDADLAVAASGDLLSRLLEALDQAGFTVPDERRKGFVDRIRDLRKLKVTRFEEGIVWDVDLFLAEGPLLESALARRRTRSLEGRRVSVMAAEDVIVLKLLAHRRKDQLDVEDILKIAPDLDIEYVKTWAARLGVTDRLREFLEEMPPGEDLA